jgi:hypothetical protein
MKEVPIRQMEEENYRNRKCRNARRKETCEEGGGRKRKKNEKMGKTTQAG